MYFESNDDESVILLEELGKLPDQDIYISESKQSDPISFSTMKEFCKFVADGYKLSRWDSSTPKINFFDLPLNTLLSFLPALLTRFKEAKAQKQRIRPMTIRAMETLLAIVRDEPLEAAPNLWSFYWAVLHVIMQNAKQPGNPAKGWVYKERRISRPEGEQDDVVKEAWLVTGINYEDGSPRDRDHKPTVSIYLARRTKIGRAEEAQASFQPGDISRSITETLAAQNVYLESPGLYASQMHFQNLVTEYEDLTNTQFITTGASVSVGAKYRESHDTLIRRCILLEAGTNEGSRNERSYGNQVLLSMAITRGLHGEVFTELPWNCDVTVFQLDTHAIGRTHVSNIKPYIYNPDLRNKIVLPETHRDLIDALVADLETFKNDMIDGKGGGTIILCQGPPGVGKAQPLDSIIQTPSGPVAMGKIKAGQTVFAADGSPCKVLRVYPQGIRPVYEVTFSDGRVARADADHIWPVKLHGQDGHLLTTKRVKSYLDSGKYEGRISIPLCEPPQFKEQKLNIDPWLLGLLLGDGFFKYKHLSISTADEFIVDKVRALLPENYRISHIGKYDYGIRIKSREGNELHEIRKELRDLGIYGLGSLDRFIPENYLSASPEQRLSLLQGLMDSDGTPGHNNNPQFSTCSEKLAADTLWLIWSLGMTGQISTKTTKTGNTCHTIAIRCKNPKSLFTLPRKRDRVKETNQYANSGLGIVSCEYVGEEPTQCILIDHPSHLYLTDAFVVTHNTLTAEVYSEITARPLYRLSSAYLGVEPEEIEKSLQKALQRAEDWNAILLIDEADVYVSKRGTDLFQNAIVATMLKQLEYYSGFLFLTTNLGNHVDDAIVSRCIARISYKIPTGKDAENIWRILSEAVGLDLTEKQTYTLSLLFPDNPPRDIKELLRLVQRYCAAKSKKPTFEDFQACALFRGINMENQSEVAEKVAKRFPLGLT